MQLALDRLLTDWPSPEEPETLVITEVLHQVTPVFRHPYHPNWPDKGQGVQGHYTSEEDTGYSASSLPPSKALIAETGQLVDLYKMLGSRAVMLLLLLLLLQPPRLAQTRAVPEGRRPAWARGQQLSQKLCTLAWSAHPPMGHVDLPREEGDDETTNEVPRIQCGDGCDPQGLRDNSQVVR